EQSRKTGAPLRIKYGIDPTAADVHLGHTVPLRKMRQFQSLGHQAVIIIGNYTAMVGDPSGRDQTRARLTAEQVEKNAQFYLGQVGKVIDLSQAEVHRNGDWFAPMTFAETLELTSKVTVAQLLTRDDFAKRMQASTPIYLHECLYPLMQAWDSVKIRADIELGGTEQLYSFMLARDLQKEQGQPSQIGLMSPILLGLDGVRRMGKSLGNYIGISEPAYDMMKKFMQLPDACLKQFYELLTDIPLDEVATLLAGHPKTAKVTLAKQVIGQYHDAAAADEAAARWQREIGEGGLPSEIPVVKLKRSELEAEPQAAQLLKAAGLCPTTSEARRVIQGGGAYVGEEKTPIAAHDQRIPLTSGMLLWVGKKRVCRVELVD
ncbi:MAG: tyrosine--tRNA ligase, partial [Planctomycetaceae bacterium]|nr:tyrosine--tRNA ligase [Planctomycetaceae bacterium]